jgi:hypothetical protein
MVVYVGAAMFDGGDCEGLRRYCSSWLDPFSRRLPAGILFKGSRLAFFFGGLEHMRGEGNLMVA